MAEDPTKDNTIDQQHGYHVAPIPKGVLGEPSKITEEAAEFADAIEQGCTVMAILELADLYGAMEAWLTGYNLSMVDLAKMSKITTRAFESGKRK